MRSSPILLCILAAAMLAAIAIGYSRAEAREPERVFLLIGQSNLNGAEGIGSFPEELVNPSIMALHPFAGWVTAYEPLPGLWRNKLGPGLFFGDYYRKNHNDVRIGLISCSKAGSSIQMWEDELWDECRKFVGRNRIDGILFFQGEADAASVEAAQAWSERFGKLKRRIASEFGDIPVVMAQLGTVSPGRRSRETAKFGKDIRKAWEDVKAQQAMAAETFSEVSMVVTEDLRTHDGLHLNLDSQKVLGERIAKKMIELELGGDSI